MQAHQRQLLAIVEQGGYPNFTSFYETLGYQVTMSYSMRKAMAIVRKQPLDVIVAEFNYQSDFRDRTSSLESLLATVERMPKNSNSPNQIPTPSQIRVIVFYEIEYIHQLKKLQTAFSNFKTMAYPIELSFLEAALLDKL